MPFQLFVVPIISAEEPTAEMNRFLRSHRIVKVDKQWIDQGSSSLWAFCVEYVDASNPAGESSRSHTARGKIDYKETMAPEDFAIFARLREIRKQIAQAEAVPVYTIFTNEQLAQMVTSRASSRTALGKIEGVGDGRLDKYADRFLEILRNAWNSGAQHEASGPVVRADSRPG